MLQVFFKEELTSSSSDIPFASSSLWLQNRPPELKIYARLCFSENIQENFIFHSGGQKKSADLKGLSYLSWKPGPFPRERDRTVLRSSSTADHWGCSLGPQIVLITSEHKAERSLKHHQEFPKSERTREREKERKRINKRKEKKRLFPVPNKSTGIVGLSIAPILLALWNAVMSFPSLARQWGCSGQWAAFSFNVLSTTIMQ